MINLNLARKPRIGDTVMYSSTLQTFNMSGDVYTDVDVSSLVGTIISVNKFNRFQVKFDDVSSLPSDLQKCNTWFVPEHMLVLV